MSRRKKNAERGTDTDMPYLCWPVGRSGDVREILAVAEKLKISKFHVIGWVVRWEELVFTHGNASGLVSQIRPKDLAAALEWKGETSKLIRALSEAGLVSCVGQKLTHPHWTRSRTAAFLREKEETRRYWREWKAEKRRALKVAAEQATARQLAAAISDFDKNVSNGHPVDVHPLSNDVHTESTLKEVRTSGSGRPPNPPRTAGGGWLRQMAEGAGPTPQANESNGLHPFVGGNDRRTMGAVPLGFGEPRAREARFYL